MAAHQFQSNPLAHFLPYLSFSLCHDSEQIRRFQRSQLRGPETDRSSVQGMIDANKKWLENFKKDSKAYPLLWSCLVGTPGAAVGRSGKQVVSDYGAAKH